MEQQGYLQIFRERWVVIIAGFILGAGVAAGLAFTLPPTYTARASLLLNVESTEGTLSDRSQYSLDRISSYPELAFSEEVLAQTIEELGLDVSVGELSGYITAVNPATTLLLQIEAEAPSAQTAADIANSVAANVSAAVSDIENSSGDDRYRTTLDISNPATAPGGPAGPQKTIIIGVGVVAGLALGLIAAIAWARLDTAVRSIAQIRRISGLPVLGELPQLSVVHAHAGGEPAAQISSTATAAESRFFRETALLRETQLAIKQANAGRLPRFLLLVPAGASAGGWLDRRAIARAIAATGRSVCLLEGESVGGSGGSSAAQHGAGMAEVLGGSLPLRDAIHPADGERFSVISRGEGGTAVSEKTAEEHIRAVNDELLADFDSVVVEATSLSQPVGLELVAPYTDGVVVMVRYGRTRTAELAHALSRIRLLGLRPLGIVLTGVPGSRLEDVVASWRPEDFAETPGAARVPVRARAVDAPTAGPGPAAPSGSSLTDDMQ
jgi:capsular polysaccharide biosynthesis protein/Mrp family chromosome partitioning ATPase